jgi:hypothetical protein
LRGDGANSTLAERRNERTGTDDCCWEAIWWEFVEFCDGFEVIEPDTGGWRRLLTIDKA